MATELVGIELELRGEEGVFRDMQKLDTMIKQLGGRHTVELELGKAKQRVLELSGAMNELKSKIKDNEKILRENAKAFNELKKASDEGSMSLEEAADAAAELARANMEAQKAIDEAKESLSALQTESADAKQEVNELNTALRNVKPLGKVFNDISLHVARVGSALQSAGNALTRFSAPMRMLLGGAVMGAGYGALGKITEGLESGFSRYDTMKKYTKVMEAFGYSEERALESRNALDQSVRGFPTGLDEIMSMAQRFTATVGDIEKGTNLAIAANNAFLASMSTETQQYQGMMQLQDVLGGKDMNAREWNSLVSSMTPAIVKMGESLGYTNENMDEFIQMVRDGKMANKDFIDTLIKVGTEEGEVAKMAEVSKRTYEAFGRNVRNAFSRMGYGVLTSLDEVVKLATNGKIETLNQLLIDNVIPAIDNYTEAVKGWIKSHPDAIIDFFNSLKGIDWKGVLRGFGQGLGDLAGGIKKLADVAGNRNLSWLGKFFAKSGAWGWLFTVTGGLLKGTRHIWAGLGTVITALVRHFGASGGIGLFGAIKRFFGGKNADKELKEIPTFSGTLKKAFSSLEGVLKMAGAITIAVGTGFVAFKGFKSMMSDLEDIIEITSRIDWEKGAGALTAMGVFIGAFMGLGKFAYTASDAASEILIGEFIVGAITTLALGFADLDLYLFERSMMHLENAINSLNRSVDLMGKIKSIPEGVTTRIGDTITAMNTIIDLFEGKNGSIKDRGEVREGLKGFSKTNAETVQNVKDALTAIIDSAESINTINGITLNTDKIEDVKESFSIALNAVVDIFGDDLPMAFQGGGATTIAQDVAGAFENWQKALGVLIGEDGIIARMKEIGSSLNNSVVVQRASGQIIFLLNNLKSAFASLLVNDGGDYASAATKMNNLADAVDSMKKAFESLKELQKIKLDTKGKNGTGDFKAIANIRSLISQLESAFETNRINSLNSQIGGFVDTVNSLLEQVKQINTEDGKITIEIHLSDKIYGDDQVINDINKLNSKIRAAVNAIQTYYKRNVTVDLRERTNRIYDSSVSGGNHWAMGGAVYRAKGGSIFRPRGTDTVPAMLTPGEYVHNRRAVNTFGIDFMRKVNNLDIRGAMGELMHRAGHMANVNRGTTITNNNYNNQRVTINNNGATGAGFTFKSASRFVGAF